MTPSVVGMGGMKICKETQINTNENMWLDQESNPRPLHHLSGALPLSYTFHLAQTTTSHWPKFYKANCVSLCVVELYSTQVLYILYFKNQTKKTIITNKNNLFSSTFKLFAELSYIILGFISPIFASHVSNSLTLRTLT